MIFFLQETLIVWSEADQYDLALSFQEKDGCDEIWEKICTVSVLRIPLINFIWPVNTWSIMKGEKKITDIYCF